MSELPSIELELLELPLRYEWKLSRNTSLSKTNAIIRVKDSLAEGIGEVAPNIRYEETADRVQLEFNSCKVLIPALLAQGISWADILEQLPACQALKTGLDMAWSRWICAGSGKRLCDLHYLPSPRPREICYTIPVMDPAAIPDFIQRERLHRFSWLKLKVNAESAMEMLNQALLHFPGKVAIDGNEAWKNPEEALAFAQGLPKERILFLEQPFPSSMREEYVRMKPFWPVEVWGDESILGLAEPEWWKLAFHGINVKLMKTGSLSRAVEMLRLARAAGLKTMIGCMVETSVGISAAMELESLADYMDLDGFMLLQEEPFRLVEEKSGRVFLIN
jgi:L-alanine-DL-glutamate epimerase-like enolase superfamily enzyme